MEGTRFEVDIRYGRGMPVAFVRAPHETVVPSHAVAIVREFLRQEFEQRLSGNAIRFVCMGPSPMWNDCFVTLEPPTASARVDVEVRDTRGYQKITFKAREDEQVGSLDDAYDLVKELTRDDLNLYYEIVSRRNILRLQRDLIESQLQDLVERNRRTGVRGLFGRLFGGGRAANDLMLEILAAATEGQRLFAGVRRDWESIRNRSEIDAFKKAFAREFEADDQTYEANAREVVALLNERYSRDVQVISLIVASLVGGVAGAAITVLTQVVAIAGLGGS